MGNLKFVIVLCVFSFITHVYARQIREVEITAEINDVNNKENADNEEFELSVIHMNDFHARFEEQSLLAGTCKPNKGPCIGGLPRVYTGLKKLLKERKNPIFLNAGDNFQGTLWYNMFKWNATERFLNLIPTAAYTLGNHEFDDHVPGVVPFIKHLKSPTVVANMNASLEPTLQGLYNRSTVIEIDGKKIGIVGVIISTAADIANTDKLLFEKEVTAVNREALRLVNEVGVFTIIVLSHCGYVIEQEIAKMSVPQIGLVVGGHSHSFLYTGTAPDGSKPVGPYPTVVKRDSDGKNVLVVQAWAYTKYLGDIVVKYDPHGEVKSWSGQPMYLGPDVPQDAELLELLEPYRKLVHERGKQILGYTNVFLDQASCRTAECNLGNLVTDSMVYAYLDGTPNGTWTRAAIAIINAGGIRSSLNIGEITYNDMTTSMPFENTIDSGYMKGKYIFQLMEDMARPYYYGGFQYANVNLLQVSGIQVFYNLSKPAGNRVMDLKLKCQDCTIPKFEEVDMEKDYPLVVVSFLSAGGDGFHVFRDHLVNKTVGPVDSVSFEKYLASHKPITTGIEGRLNFVGSAEPIYTPRHLRK